MSSSLHVWRPGLWRARAQAPAVRVAVAAALLLGGSAEAWAGAAAGAAMTSAATDIAARLVTQLDLALQHAGFAWQADARGLRTHVHHVVNIVAGSRSMYFQASFGNPGDGYGALEYARDLRGSAEVAAAGWGESAQLVASWLEQALQRAVQAAGAADAGDATRARANLAEAVAFLSAAKGRPGEKAPAAGAASLQEGIRAAAAQAPAAPPAPGGGYY